MKVKEEGESFSKPYPCDSISGSSSSQALWLWGCCGQDVFQGGCRGQEVLFGSVMSTTTLRFIVVLLFQLISCSVGELTVESVDTGAQPQGRILWLSAAWQL